MKILLDENMPLKFRRLLPEHEAITVEYMGWKGLRNGKLLAAAAEMSFDALITLDVGMSESQNRGSLPVSVLLLRPDRTDLESLTAMIPAVLSALGRMKPRTFVSIPEK
ncbi:MAG: DUF5615 family PIN-like protein [Phycisphaeraceae bacterium]|nr:DUF5615 family PIN-like protein [Phycisphaeraceae bacterium]